MQQWLMMILMLQVVVAVVVVLVVLLLLHSETVCTKSDAHLSPLGPLQWEPHVRLHPAIESARVHCGLSEAVVSGESVVVFEDDSERCVVVVVCSENESLVP